jgi:hypothetical protein
MSSTTSGNTGPCTTVMAGSVGDPKIPTMVGDSWRPAMAGLLGVAITGAAIAGASLMGGASATAARHAAAVPAQQGVAVAAAALTSPKYPDDGGD